MPVDQLMPAPASSATTRLLTTEGVIEVRDITEGIPIDPGCTQLRYLETVEKRSELIMYDPDYGTSEFVNRRPDQKLGQAAPVVGARGADSVPPDAADALVPLGEAVAGVGRAIRS